MKRCLMLAMFVCLLFCLSGCCSHDWQEATCTEPKTCAKCGATEGEALGHDYSEWQITVEPTYSADGEQAQTCSRCGDVVTEAIPQKSIDGVSVVDDQGFCVTYSEFLDFFEATLNKEVADIRSDVYFEFREEDSLKGSSFIYLEPADYDLQTGVFLTKNGDEPKEDGSFDQLLIMMTGTSDFIQKFNATFIMFATIAVQITNPSIATFDEANAVIVDASSAGATVNTLFSDYRYGDFLYTMRLEMVGETEMFSFIVRPAE